METCPLPCYLSCPLGNGLVSNERAARLQYHFSRRVFVHQPEVMLGVLEMSFSFNRVARGGRGPREHYVSLKALLRIGGRIGAAQCQT